jgi:hypothetical protein
MVVFTFIIAFVPRTTIGLPLYFACFPLLLASGCFYIRYYYYVGNREVKKMFQGQDVYALSCSRASREDKQIQEKGKLVVTADSVYFLVKQRGKLTFALQEEINELDSFTTGFLKDEQYGFFFHKGIEDIEFSCKDIDKKRDSLIHALEWDEEVPTNEEVMVKGKAADAPLFTEVNKKMKSKGPQSN